MVLGIIDSEAYIDTFISIAAYPPMGSGPLIIHSKVVVFDEQPQLEIRVGRLYLLCP